MTYTEIKDLKDQLISLTAMNRRLELAAYDDEDIITVLSRRLKAAQDELKLITMELNGKMRECNTHHPLDNQPT